MDTNSLYLQNVEKAYNESNKVYNIVMDCDSGSDLDEYVFLQIVESMTVFPLYARTGIMPIKKKEDTFELNLKLNSDYQIDLSPIAVHKNIVNDKIREVAEESSEYKKYLYDPQTKKKIPGRSIRKIFDYEIRDTVAKYLPNSYITNAWCKLYEILSAYNMFAEAIESIETFHICEHPGAFIYAIRDYIKSLNKDIEHTFTFQSLKPKFDKQIFESEEKLLKDHSDKLDYGADGTGDITNVENILYYVNKYKNNNIELITSDCGLDCSADFVSQGNTLQPIFMGALLCAIGIAKKGSWYISKIFNFNEQKIMEMLYIGSYFYESVDIVRPLTTKEGSREVYVVYKNFKYEHDKIQNIYDKLIEYYTNYDQNTNIVDSIDSRFLKRVFRYDALLSMWIITNMNYTIFRMRNKKFVSCNPIIKTYIKQYANYQAEYYVTYIKLNKQFIE